MPYQFYSTRSSPIVSDDDGEFYSTRRLIRHNSKRQRSRLYNNEDDHGHDDYPYSKSHSRPSHALTTRQPSQIMKYNIWSPLSSSKHKTGPYPPCISDDEDVENTYRYKYTTTQYPPATRAFSDDDERDRERKFRLRIETTFDRPKSSHSSEHKAMAWSSDMFRRREKWVDEDLEVRGRSRRESILEDEPVKETLVRVRRAKRTRTDEWKPLRGLRRP